MDQKLRLKKEATFQDRRMDRALSGQGEFRDKFYFINRMAQAHYEKLHLRLSGKRVVVVGSSDVGVTPLARQGAYVDGIDISPVSIEKLSRSINEEGLAQFASAKVMNAECLEYGNASIDMISCSGVLHHINTERALRSWSRCLTKTGAAILFEPLAYHPAAALFRVLTPSMRTEDEHPLRPKDFRLMHRYFRHVKRTDYGLLTPLSALLSVVPGMAPAARALLRPLEVTDTWILKFFPLLGNLCWLTVIELRDPRL